MNISFLSPDLVLDPILPLPVIVLLGLVVAVVTIRLYRRVGTGLSRGRATCLLVLRLAGLAVIVPLLLQPSRIEKIQPPNRDRVTLVAVDTSRSMKQRDVNGASRLDAARNLLLDAKALAGSGLPEDPRLRLFEFNDDAQPITGSLFDVEPRGTTTHFHKSLMTALNTLARDETAQALIVVSDGHDFELINPARTGAAARSRQTPIYALAVGRQGKVRDIATRITSFQPYCYVKQQARIAAVLRLIGCEFEDLTVQLLRHGQVAQSRRVNADELQELPVEFDVVEPATGQFEYEVRVQPLPNEVDTDNNSAITYLNVIDQQLRVLILEGAPYWDTTFLQRSLMRNDKFEVDALVGYGPGKVRAVRKTTSAGELRAPANAEAFSIYDLVILGRSVDRLLQPAQVDALNQYVQERGGTVIFSRGPAFDDPKLGGELEPVIWSEDVRRNLRLQATTEGRNLGAVRSSDSGAEPLPDLLTASEPKETRPLASTLALAAERPGAEATAALVHRRLGRGQVASFGVAGLWRWGLNSKIQGANTAFDRFWDQVILWLLAGRDFIPSSDFSFRTSSANVQLGEKVYFRLALRRPDPAVQTAPVSLFLRDREVGRTELRAAPNEPGRLMAEFVPTEIGRYRAEVRLPDGSRQQSRFMVFTENFEETEVATDPAYLRRLCEGSGGRLLEPAELRQLLAELASAPSEAAPQTRLRPIWNDVWVFYLAGLLFSLDWLLRRRWGLS